MRFNTNSINQESHIQWLDRQDKGTSGYPFFMSQYAIDWLREEVRCFLIPCIMQGRTPNIDEIVRHWSRQKDLPYDLFFLFQDGLRGVTHKALIDIYPSLMLTVTALKNLRQIINQPQEVQQCVC